jgi:acyl-CoA thioesterase I
MRHLLLLTLLLFLTSCTVQVDGISYLPIGDSYTIGTGADMNWPTLLTDSLRKNGTVVSLVAEPARVAYQIPDVISSELPLVKIYEPDLVTLQIGVNDWVNGKTAEDFRKDYQELLDLLYEFSPDSKVVLVTIPDFGATPAGSQYANGRDISDGISTYNDIIRSEAKVRGLLVADIFYISQQLASQQGMLATDGLHPSADQYAIWLRTIQPVILESLEDNT